MSLKKKVLGGLVAGVASVGLLASGATAATALTYSPEPAVDGQTLTVSSTSTDLPAGNYRVGVCTVENMGTIPIAPACGAYTENDVTLDESGQIKDVEIGVVKEVGNDNAHSGIPGQGDIDKFNCGPGECEVVIASHPTTGAGEVVESQVLVFE